MVRIIADTTCSIPLDILKSKGVEVLPQFIIFGENTYRDDTEMDAEMFLKKLTSSSILPKTAAPPPALYNPIFQKYASRGETMIAIAPSSDVSGTYRSIEVAIQEFPNADIRLIDSRAAASGLGSIVLQAAEMAQAGKDADTITSHISNLIPRLRIYFLVDTLEYLHRGGRIGGAKALVGSLLQVKPILQLKNGRIEAADSERTKKRAVARLKEIVLSECPPGKNSNLSVSHANAEEEAKSIASDLGIQLGLSAGEIPLYSVPPAIIVHAGPGVVAVNFFTDHS